MEPGHDQHARKSLWKTRPELWVDAQRVRRTYEGIKGRAMNEKRSKRERKDIEKESKEA